MTEQYYANSQNIRVNIDGSETRSNVSWLCRESERSLVRNPNWKAFLATNGYSPISPYTRINRERTGLDGILVRQYQTAGRSTFHGLMGVDTFPVNLHSDRLLSWTDSIWGPLVDEAVSRANDKVTSRYAGLAETMVEANKSSTMMLQSAKTLVSAFRNVRRGNFGQAATALGLTKTPKGVSKERKLASNWLAYRYGWMPIYLNIYGTLVWAYERNRRPRVGRAVGRSKWASEVRSTSTRDSVGFFEMGNSTALQFSHKSSVEATVEVGYYYRISNSTTVDLDQLGLLNPIGLAWELLPLSFVVDWFVNVGDYINQLTTWTGKEFLDGWITKRQTVLASTKIDSAKISSWSTNRDFDTLGLSPKFTDREFGLMRTRLLNPPTFGLSLQNNLSAKRIADAIALVTVFSKLR